MALTNYTELQAAVAAWSNRRDLTALIPDFITLAEDRINRALRVREMQVEMTPDTIFEGVISVPSGTVGVKTIWLDSDQKRPLEARPYEDLLARGTTGTPTGWARQGESFYFDGAGDVAGVLYHRIAALADDAETNWLLTTHPNVYLYGALAELFDYTRNDGERDRWLDKFEATIADLNAGDMRDRYAGPLTVRVR